MTELSERIDRLELAVNSLASLLFDAVPVDPKDEIKSAPDGKAVPMQHIKNTPEEDKIKFDDEGYVDYTD